MTRRVNFISRVTSEADVLDGFSIPKGTTVRVPIYSLQVDPDIWGDDAADFNLERWFGGNGDDKDDDDVASKKRIRETRAFFSVFWHGSRGCVGQRFAILETKAFVAAVIRRGIVSFRDGDEKPMYSGPFGDAVGLKLYMKALD